MSDYPLYTTRPVVKKKKGKKRFITLFLAVLILIPSGLYMYAALYKNPPTVSAAVSQLALAPPTQPAVAWPAQGQAAIGSVENGLLASSSPTEQVKPIASMAKVVTALAVMKKKPFAVNETGAVLTMDTQDVAYYSEYLAKNGSVVIVANGETLSQYQALEAMMLPSANNMANSMVRWAFGSMDEYVTYANAMVKEMGLTKTVISDASGYSSATVSTPSEMIMIGQAALKDPVIAKVVAEQEATIPVAGDIRNTNKLLVDSSVVGIKTGTTDEAGACLLFAGKHEIDSAHSVTIIGVVMGSTNPSTVFPAAKSLLDSAERGFDDAIEVQPAGAVVASIVTPWGARSAVVTKDPLTVYGWKGASIQTVPTIPDTVAPKKAGEVVGKLTVTNIPDVSTDLVLASDLNAPTAWWKLTNYF